MANSIASLNATSGSSAQIWRTHACADPLRYCVDLNFWDGRLDQLAEGLLYLYAGEEDKEQALAIGFAAMDLSKRVR